TLRIKPKTAKGTTLPPTSGASPRRAATPPTSPMNSDWRCAAKQRHNPPYSGSFFALRDFDAADVSCGSKAALRCPRPHVRSTLNSGHDVDVLQRPSGAEGD